MRSFSKNKEWKAMITCKACENKFISFSESGFCNECGEPWSHEQGEALMSPEIKGWKVPGRQISAANTYDDGSHIRRKETGTFCSGIWYSAKLVFAAFLCMFLFNWGVHALVRSVERARSQKLTWQEQQDRVRADKWIAMPEEEFVEKFLDGLRKSPDLTRSKFIQMLEANAKFLSTKSKVKKGDSVGWRLGFYISRKFPSGKKGVVSKEALAIQEFLKSGTGLDSEDMDSALGVNRVRTKDLEQQRAYFEQLVSEGPASL